MPVPSHNNSYEIYKVLTRAITLVIIINGEKRKAEKVEYNIF